MRVSSRVGWGGCEDCEGCYEDMLDWSCCWDIILCYCLSILLLPLLLLLPSVSNTINIASISDSYGLGNDNKDFVSLLFIPSLLLMLTLVVIVLLLILMVLAVGEIKADE